MNAAEMRNWMNEIKSTFTEDWSREASALDVAYKKGEDFRIFNNHPVSLKWSNMSGGFPVKMMGKEFYSTEHLYQLAHFRGETEKGREIQEEIMSIPNGFLMKKKVMRPNKEHIREDWETDPRLKYEWMLYIVWLKVQQNKLFAKTLTDCPVESLFIEDSTGCSGSAKQWGCHNKEHWKTRKEAEKSVERRFGKSGKVWLMFQDLKKLGVCSEMLDKNRSMSVKDLKVAARNNVEPVGRWEGMNMMGKILKLCQLALLTGTEPEIDHELINAAHINILGKEIYLQRDIEKKVA